MWPIGKVALEELYVLKKIDYGMFQPKEKIESLVYFYQHQLREGKSTKVVKKCKKILVDAYLVDIFDENETTSLSQLYY